jgi:nucleoside-diphosphate-sugar epimerase
MSPANDHVVGDGGLTITSLDASASRGVEGDRPRTVLLTGATSLLGRLVAANLIARGHRVVALLRPTSPVTAESMWSTVEGITAPPHEELTILRGDVRELDLGLERDEVARLAGVEVVVHLARPRAGEQASPNALVDGHKGVIGFARRLGSLERLVVLSSTAVAGDYTGRFYEDWLDIGQSHPSAAERQLVQAERYAREAATYLPVVVARHALLVGHSLTGQIECRAGLSRLFSMVEKLALLPSFVHPLGPAHGERYLTVSPVDYVARGIVELCTSRTVLPGTCTCFADPEPPTLAEFWDTLLDRVGGPTAGVRIPVVDKGVTGWAVQSLARNSAWLSGLVGRGEGPWVFLLQRGEHDVTNARRLLGPVGVRCPKLATYLDALYEDYQRRKRRS